MGRSKAIVSAGPIPGKTPIKVPRKVPIKPKSKLVKVNALLKPWRRAVTLFIKFP
jgi:hypothetical protein